MQGDSLAEFIDDILTMGGPEKEFVFRGTHFFLEARFNRETNLTDLMVSQIKPRIEYEFSGETNQECFEKFAKAPIFDGLNLYEAEKEITVIFG